MPSRKALVTPLFTANRFPSVITSSLPANKLTKLLPATNQHKPDKTLSLSDLIVLHTKLTSFLLDRTKDLANALRVPV